MKKFYFSALFNKDIFYKGDQMFLKRRVFLTFQNLIKTFYKQDIKSFSKVLDLGAGDNSFIKVVKENGIDGYGLDIDDINLENEKINFDDDYFDLITGISLIEHIVDPSNFLKESLRVLRKNGFLILVTPDWKHNVKDFFDDPTHVKPYTKNSLEFLLKSFGFDQIKIVPWLVCKPSWMWKIPFSFELAKIIPFRGSRNKLIPEFLKGNSKSILIICQK